jgi:heme/copper-type cytochrome/quinol oxidase subunit 2
MNELIQILACPTCARAFQETQGDAAGYAILFMVCIIMPVAASIIIFIIRIAYRQKKADTGEFADPFLKNTTH